jgi:predicted oxidoreductase
VAHTYQADVIIAGGGLAGVVTAYELLDSGKRVLILEKDTEERFGGLAKESFGGIMLVGTPHQKRSGIRDSPELAWSDWNTFAHFGPDDAWPKRWAQFYCENTLPLIYEFCDQKGVKFLPVVNWPERGVDGPGNSVPRWHITWGTGYELARGIIKALDAHPNRAKLEILFEHEVSGFSFTNGQVDGVHGKKMRDGAAFTAAGECVVVASGGMCGGDLSKAREHWYKPWGEPPAVLLNGAHAYGDGMLHDRAQEIGANITHLDKQWHYAAGVHHPAKRKPHDGLSLVPPRSALWVNAHGVRIRNPAPIVGYTDTRHLVESVLKEPGKYSWQVMNAKIAARELAVSGSTHMKAFRNKNKLMLVKHLLFGNQELVDQLVRECPDDFVVANSLPELVEGMNQRNLFDLKTDLATLEQEIKAYDWQIDGGPAYFNDDQLRRIMNFRTYRGDKLRTCKYQKILDPKAMPLIAIREFILARKSLGGIQTDMQCRVLRADGAAIPGLYAVGEAAGFGGGGIHGLGSLEGTFLGSCILTGRVCGRAIAGG